MDGVTLLAEARAAGLTVAVEGDRLTVRGPRRAAAVAERLIAGKEQVIEALAHEAPAEADELPARPDDRPGYLTELTYKAGRWGWRRRPFDAADAALEAFRAGERAAQGPGARSARPGSLPGHVAGLGVAPSDSCGKLASRGPDGLTALERVAQKPGARLPRPGSLSGGVAGLGVARCDSWGKLARRGPDGHLAGKAKPCAATARRRLTGQSGIGVSATG